ncbi:hypothetical protein EI94DRAFT_1833216 [Lactarius quietus]|nr:hypothetical protein EI94DRAFT_1833216 [Lactarius quietus]
MRLLSPPDFNVFDVMVDERAGICITAPVWGGFTVIHLFSSTVLWCLPRSYVGSSSYCRHYDNGYLVFDNHDSEMEVWRLTNGNVPRATAVYHQYAPLGQFRPWALLRLPNSQPPNLFRFRLAYPTLICAIYEHTFLYDVRTGSLEQQFNLLLYPFAIVCDVDVNERYAIVCESHVVHVISRESGRVVLRIPVNATAWCSQSVDDTSISFIAPVPVHPKVDEYHCRDLLAARVSRDGCDLVVLSSERRLLFVRDFERICRGETTLEQAALVLGIPNRLCLQLVFKHGRVYMATIQGHYIFTFGSDLFVKAVYVRSVNSTTPRTRPGWTGNMVVTDSRIYFMSDERRRRDIPLFEDEENSQELPPPIPPTLAVILKSHCTWWRSIVNM